MRSTSSLRAILASVSFLAAVGAQSSHVLTMFGMNVNFYMAALPALAMIVPLPVVVFSAVAGAVMLKTLPVFEMASLVLLAIAFAIAAGRRLLPLHPLVQNPLLSAAGVAGFYALMNRAMFSARGALPEELFVTALISLLCTVLAQHFNEKR